MEKIRTFVAISLPANILRALGELQDHVKPQSRAARWVKPQSIHLTLKFLGNLAPAELQKVFTGMDIAETKMPPAFELRTEGVGCFPSVKRPRVLWVGVRGEDFYKLQEVQQRIESVLKEQGFPPEERRFSPHLTVARIRNGDRRLSELMDIFINYPFPALSFPVREIQVMRSDLRPDGAVYSVQKSYKLREV